jgi:hypothetical protein
MKKFCFPITLILFLITGPDPIPGQSLQVIMDKLNLYNQKYPEEIVYVHSDRNRYSPGDIIWFKAYIITDLGEKPNLSRDLYLGLVDRDGQEVAHAKFLVDIDHVNGDLEIPLQVSPGNYMLMAYTSWMKNTPVERIFTKEITIEDDVPGVAVTLKLNDTLFTGGSTVRADIECLDNKNIPVAAPFQYKLTADGSIVLQGENKTDKSGKAQVTVVLPEGNAGSKYEITVDVTDKNRTSRIGIVIPTPENILDVSFYPESGMLIMGKASKIAFRAFNVANRPANFEGEIFDNEKLVTTIVSSSDGIGSFVLVPEREQVYTLKITKPAGIKRTFELPETFRSGLLVGIKESTRELLTFEVRQIYRQVQTYHFIAQMKGRIYWMESRRIDETGEVVVPLGDFPAGVAEISAFDTNMTLMAKRLFYVNQHKKLQIEIIPDKQQYTSKEKTSLTIRVKDENGNPVKAVLSLAVSPEYFQQSHSDNSDLFSLVSLKSDLTGFIPSPSSYFKQDETSLQLLDNLLIANTYNRFTWKTILKTGTTSPAYVNMDNNKNATGTDFNAKAAAYCGNYLTGSLTAPGNLYTLQPKNDVASWSRDISHQPANSPYSGRLTVREIVHQIRPYDVIGGKIFFVNTGGNSINNQDGAIIAINGILMGTNIAVLDGIQPADIGNIKVSTRPMDIQKYTGLNTMGVIEIETKVNDTFKKPAAMPEPEHNEYRASSEFNISGKNTGSKGGKSKSTIPVTTYWNPEIRTDSSGIAEVSYFNTKTPGEISVTVEGISETGLCGSSGIAYLVK